MYSALYLIKSNYRSVLCSRHALLTVLLFCLVGMVAAAPLPLSTTQSGTVSGDLYVGAFQDPAWNSQSSTPGVKEFNQSFTIPSFTSVQWARLETVVYAAGTDNRHGQTTVKFDGNGDGSYETILGVEDQQTASSGDAEVYPVNDHMDRCYSDYRVWYDVTSLVTSQNPAAYVKTENLDSSSFDGRVKEITLIVAYNDGDSDLVKYWVNTGHDYQAAGASGVTTSFDTTAVSSGITNAILKNVAIASKDAIYTFNTLSPAGANPVAPYNFFEKNSWDVTSGIVAGSGSTFGYTNNGGSFKTTLATLTVRSPPAAQPDLIVTAISPNAGAGAFLFANESNVISVTVKNNGTAAAGASTLGVDVSGAAYTASVGALNAGVSQTVTVTDTVSRTNGTVVRINATAEGGKYLTSDQTVYNNGYKSKRFTGGSDMNTQATYEGRYRVLYSTGNSVYQGSGWSSYSTTWTADNLPVPEGSTIISARLYQDYTWDQTAGPDGHPAWTVTYNSNPVTPVTTYKDTKGYGTYNFPSGVYVYDVTSLFNTAGNSMTLTAGAGNDNGIYGPYLVVVYQDPATTVKKIWINEECDLLYSGSARSTSNEEATTYAGFSGVDTTGVSNARIITICPSADESTKNPKSSSFFFNSQTYSAPLSSGWLENPQIAFTEYDVTSALTSGANTARFQSTISGSSGDNLVATNAILIVEKADPAPISNFTATPTSGNFPLSVQFTDQSTGSITSYAWDFGDSETSTLQSPQHTYSSAGTYSVNLTVTGPGGSNSKLKTNYISVITPPVAPISNFTATPSSGNSPLSVQFTDQSIGSITSYAWDFGDSGTSTLQSPQHTYSSAGTYSVNLTVTGPGGSNSKVRTNYISVSTPPVAPVSNFTATPTSGNSPLSVQFTDQSIGSITSYAWDFGDSGTSTLQSPQHTYSSAGTYSVNLTVTGPGGSNSKVRTNYISVTSSPIAPVAAFTATPVIGLVPLSVAFSDQSTGTPSSWNWESRPAATGGSWTSFSTVQNPTNIFAAGAYDIRLTATNTAGSNTVTKTQYLSVSAGPKPLTPVTSGTVSGDLYVGAFQPVPWNNQSSTPGVKTFIQTYTIPQHTTIQWARLYAVVYAAGTDNRSGQATVSFDGNGDGTYETVLGTETLATASTSAADVYPVNDHVNKQYSDYMIWYDVTPLVNANTINAHIVTENIGGSSFDGRLKELTLVIAYNDGDSDLVKYWVNEGHDYQSSSGSAVTTIFGTSSLVSGWASAELTNVMLSSKDASYTLNIAPYSGANPVSPYASFGKNVWDVKTSLTSGSNSNFVYMHAASSSFKTTLATLKVRYGTVPVANFTGAPTSGNSPLSVQFTDQSTGSITSYSWDFGDSGTSTLQNPSHIYTTAGTYSVNLTVAGSGGSNSKIRTNYISVSTPPVAPVANFTGAPTDGDSPLSVQFTDQSTGSITSYSWDFGDSGTSTLQSPQHTYSSAGTYSVNLTVAGPGGSNSKIRTNYISVSTPPVAPVANFTGAPTDGDSPLSVQFTDQSTGSITSYSWDFGDSGTSTLQNPSHMYTTTGTYSVNLTVAGRGGSNSKIRTNYISVSTPPVAPVANFTGAPTDGDSPLSVQFTDQSTGSITSYAWGFGDSGTSTLQSPQHTYSSAGTYSVNLTVAGPGGSNSKIRTNYISVSTPPVAPVANFTGAPTDGDSPLSVQFTDQSTGSITSYSWDFGDSGTSTLQNPQHTYSSAGTYSVNLTVAGPGGSNSKIRTNYISVSTPPVAPVANFTGAPTDGDSPLSVQFTDQSTGSITSYSWDFGDSGTSTLQSPQHTYSSAGTYSVNLTVAGPGGSNSKIRTNYISVSTPPVAPVANFTGAPTDGDSPLSVQFTDQSTGSITSYAWGFGDSGTSTLQSPQHTYSSAGTYSVNLTVTGPGGSNSKIRTNYISVSTPPVAPVANFTGAPTDGDSPLSVQFTDQSTGSITSYAWGFGDSGTSTLQSPQHTYSSAGTYSVNLTVTGPGGSNSKIRTNYISVSTPPVAPVANFTGAPTDGDSSLSVQFTDQSTGSITSYAWDFGDSGTSTLQNPSHTYSTAGTYSVNLTVTGPGGSNSKFRTNYISVTNPPKPTFLADFTVSPMFGIAPLTVQCTDKSIGNPTRYNYDFGDGTNVTGPNPVHTYRYPGTFNITLTITKYNSTTNSIIGSSTTKTNVVTVSRVPFVMPVAKFIASPTKGMAPLSVTFIDQSSGNPTFYNYDFGDGINMTGPNPIHTYRHPGVYNVTMTVLKYDRYSGSIIASTSLQKDLIIVNGG